jgi:hypothetical protein
MQSLASIAAVVLSTGSFARSSPANNRDTASLDELCAFPSPEAYATGLGLLITLMHSLQILETRTSANRKRSKREISQ